jgi:hypothetical protein
MEKGCVLCDVRTEVEAALVERIETVKDTEHAHQTRQRICINLGCGDNLDLPLHEQKVKVQLYLIFRYLKTLTTSRYSCICARSFSLKTGHFWPKAHTNTFSGVKIWCSHQFVVEGWGLLWHDAVSMGELVPTIRRNVISSSSGVKRRIGFFLRPLDLQDVCITFLCNVENLPPSGHDCPVSWTYSDGSCSAMYVCVAVKVPLPSACRVVIVLLLFVTASYQHRHSLTGTVCYAQHITIQ